MAMRRVDERGAGWRGVLVFLALAFGLSWAAQVAVALAVRQQPQGLAALGGGLLPVAVALMWPPAVGAWVSRRWVEGGDYSDAGLRRPAWRYVLVAWFGPLVLTMVSMVLSLPLYPFDPSFPALRALAEQAGQPLPADPAVIVFAQVVAALTLAVPLNAVFAFGEEFGWRGYLLPRLRQRLGPWPGVLAHGAIWGFWHAPLILLLGYNFPGHPVAGVALFTVAGALGGVLLAWLQLASRSVVPPTIAHAAFNACGGLPFLLLRGVDPAIGGVAYSPIGWLALLGAIALVARHPALRRGPDVRHP